MGVLNILLINAFVLFSVSAVHDPRSRGVAEPRGGGRYSVSIREGSLMLGDGTEEKKKLMKITYVGHSTLILETGAYRILVDPFWKEKILWQKRRILPALKIEDIPKPNSVLITHAHPDHCDLEAVERHYRKGLQAVVMPCGTARKALTMGLPVREMAVWERIELGPAYITAVPAKHLGRCLGYIVEINAVTVYITGDTLIFRDLVRVHREFDVDLMAMPYGGSPFMGIIWDFDDAVEAVKIVRPRFVLPVHRETFSQWLFTPPTPAEFARRLRKECPFTTPLPLDEGDSLLVYP